MEIKNPFALLKKLPEDTQIKFIPTEEMILAVIAECNSEQKKLVQFAYETAARIGECINLDYEDIKEDFIILYTRKSRNSNRIPRFVPKPKFIEDGKGKVFKDWTAYPRFLEKKVRELGQPKWGWHGLRRRRASIWAHQDKPLFEIMMLLGHSQISTTQRYLFSLGIVKL